MNLLYMLLCLVLIVIAALAYQKMTYIQEIREGFDITTNGLGDIVACPTNWNLTPELSSKGITTCNEKGKPVCALVSDDATKDGIPSCTKMFHDYLETQGVEFCPSTMPNYFENPVTAASGCTSGAIASDMSSAKDPSVPTCTIYKSTQNFTEKDSCYNQKELASTILFGNDATKQLVPLGGSPLVYTTQMTYHVPGQTGLTHTCYPDKQTMAAITTIQQQGSTDPKLLALSSRISTGTSKSSCEAQYKVYIAKSMNESNLTD